MRYELLLLDADDTLFDYDKAEAYAFKAACADLEVNFDAERQLPVYRRVNHGMWKALERGEISPELLKTERFRVTFGELGLAVDPLAFGDAYLDHLGEADFLMPEAEETVAALGRTHTLVMLTNGLARVQRSRFARSPLLRHFSRVVISDEVGAKKPDPAIFEMATAAHRDVPKERILMVGDSLSSDIQGSVNYGIDSCWVNLRGRAAPDSPLPTYEIARLPELLSLV